MRYLIGQFVACMHVCMLACMQVCMHAISPSFAKKSVSIHMFNMMPKEVPVKDNWQRRKYYTKAQNVYINTHYII